MLSWSFLYKVILNYELSIFQHRLNRSGDVSNSFLLSPDISNISICFYPFKLSFLSVQTLALILAHQYHFPACEKRTGSNFIKIDTGCQFRRIKLYLVRPCIQIIADQFGYSVA